MNKLKIDISYSVWRMCDTFSHAWLVRDPPLGELLFQTCTIFYRTAKHTIASCCQEY